MQPFHKHLQQQANDLIRKANNLQQRPQRTFAYRAAILTVYGFQVAIPVVLAILIGYLLDKHFPVIHFSWMLNCILLGFLIGLYNANRWFYNMMELQSKRKKKGGQK